MHDTKINIVVVDNHTLGYMLKGSLSVGVLHQSVLRGAVGTTDLVGSISSYRKNIRLATERDFADFLVCSERFRNDDNYHYVK